MCGHNVEMLNVKPGGTYSYLVLRFEGLIKIKSKFSSYRAVNTLRLGYENQSINDV